MEVLRSYRAELYHMETTRLSGSPMFRADAWTWLRDAEGNARYAYVAHRPADDGGKPLSSHLEQQPECACGGDDDGGENPACVRVLIGSSLQNVVRRASAMWGDRPNHVPVTIAKVPLTVFGERLGLVFPDPAALGWIELHRFLETLPPPVHKFLRFEGNFSKESWESWLAGGSLRPELRAVHSRLATDRWCAAWEAEEKGRDFFLRYLWDHRRSVGSVFTAANAHFRGKNNDDDDDDDDVARTVLMPLEKVKDLAVDNHYMTIYPEQSALASKCRDFWQDTVTFAPGVSCEE